MGWSAQGAAGFPSNHCSLITYRYGACAGAGGPRPRAPTAPAGAPPTPAPTAARPACSHSHPGQPCFPAPTILPRESLLCLLATGRGLPPSPVEPEPRGRIRPSRSGTALRPVLGSAGRPPGQASQTRTGCGPAPRGLGPPPPAPRSPGPSSRANLQLQLPHPPPLPGLGTSPGAGQRFSCGINTFG